MNYGSIVTEQSPPLQSRLVDWYRDADLLDSFAVQLPAGFDADIRSIGQVILGRPAPWFKALLAIRYGVVGAFGIKTSAEISEDHNNEDRIDFFPIISQYDNEIILGEDDRHLNVRISLLIEREAGRLDLVVATTAVRCHNRLGRAYLIAIKPFHRLVVRSFLRRAVKTGFVVPSKP